MTRQHGDMEHHQTTQSPGKCGQTVCWPCLAFKTNQPIHILDRANFNSKEKRANHQAKSLETLVENLVKNWEIEASHKMDVSQWRTVDPERYTFAINGGPPQDAEHMLKVCVVP